MAKTIAEVVAPQYQRWLRDVSRIAVPALKLDYASLFPNFGALQADAWKSALPGLKLIQDAQRQQFAEVIAAARRALEAALPPNWRREDISIPSDLEVLLLDEGLPLAWVPPAEVVARLFSAANASARRRIIGRRWKMIVRACMEELDEIEEPSLRDHVFFARRAAETLLSGSHEASQALSANLLDSVLRAEFTDAARKTITGRTARLNIEDYPLRVSIVLGGIWGAHGQFWSNQGDKIPRSYSRHGSAHGVSRRQYSRINAVLALMHVVSLLRLIDVDLSDK
ncbi:MAG: hypothetical protein M3450_01260 [Actinomycetota bacterium]|nr:hypothetical protein [Actinomycetota bacterium]